MRPVSVTRSDDVFFPQILAQIDRLHPNQLAVERAIKILDARLSLDADQLFPPILVQIVGIDDLRDSGNWMPLPSGILVPPRSAHNIELAIAIHIDGMNVDPGVRLLAIYKCVFELRNRRRSLARSEHLHPSGVALF